MTLTLYGQLVKDDSQNNQKLTTSNNVVDETADSFDIADTLVEGQASANENLSSRKPQTEVSHTSMAHFKIIDILGKGGMGAVYKAKDLTLERFVAIKTLRVSDAEQPMIIAEAKNISRLNHPNIVTVYDIARDEEENFIVMEWVDGRSLSAEIPSTGLPLKTVIAYSKQIISALENAHQHLIIHRDIKPQNIMVETCGRIKVLDFGIAALLETEAGLVESSAAQNDTMALSGSPQYMSPEQALNQSCDARSDLFSFGIVLYEMLTGVKPFLGINVKQISRAIIQQQYTPLAEAYEEANKGATSNSASNSKAELPSELTDVVDKLLQKSPEDRYQNATELAGDIDAINEQINHKVTWWQQQHWLTKTLIIAPIIAILGMSVRSIVFPPSTQDLIARQLVESKKIAFLPFDNISGDPVLQIFSDGIATMLSTDLAEVGYQQGDGTTWVLPTSDIKNLEDPSVAGIYNKYGVDFIITGSIQHMGSTRSIHLSLVNGTDGRQLKTKQLTIDATKLFEAQTQIRQQVMALLGWQLPESLSQQFAAKKPALDGAYKHYLQGQGYLYRFDHADNINKALKAFQAAIELDPKYADAYVGLAQAELRSFIETKNVDDLDMMIETVEQLESVSENHSLLPYLKAEVMLRQGKYADSVDLFKSSIVLKPNFFNAYTGLSDAYIELNDSTQAERTLMAAYQLMPNNNAALSNLGVLHFSNGHYKKAIKYFELLATKAPNNYIAYLNLSACHYLNGDVQEAIVTAEKSLAIQPNADGYANLGTYHFIVKDYEQAVDAYEKMIALSEEDYIKWGNLADAYYFARNSKYIDAFKQAIRLGEEALNLNPKNKVAISSLAYYHANIGNVDAAYYYANKINESDIGENQFFIAATYARIGNITDSLKYLEWAIDNNYSIAEISNSPLFESLRNESAYKELLSVR